MRRLLLAALPAALLATLAPNVRSSPAPLTLPALARVDVRDARQAAEVAGQFDETHALLDGQVEVVLWPGDLERLRRMGRRVHVLDKQPDFSEPADSPLVQPAAGPARSTYRHYSDHVAELRDLANRHPQRVRLIQLREKSLEGRFIMGVEIAENVKAVDGRPAFLIDGIHHAREWPAGEYPMDFAHYLVENARLRHVGYLLKSARFVIIPVMNPDGFDFSRTSLLDGTGVVGVPLGLAGAGGYWRKNRRADVGLRPPGSAHYVDSHGVDPNRNYAWHWGDDQGGSSSDKTGQTYRGTKALSEPETRNVAHLLHTRPFIGYITNHTYSRLVLRPWGDTEDESPDEKLFYDLGEVMAEDMGGYQNIPSLGLYLTTGTAQDYAYATTATLSYTFEHGTEFHPSYATTAENSTGVIAAYLHMAEAVINAKNHSVLRGRVVDGSGRPVPATIAITKSFANELWPNNPSGEESYAVDVNWQTAAAGTGEFEWHLPPSTRPAVQAAKGRETYRVTISAPGLKSATRTVFVRRGQAIDLGTVRLTR